MSATTVLHHHERWDGTGYPFGLVGEDIPLGARVLSVCDVFDTITFEQRPYHDHVLGRKEALEEILQSAGSQFDPEVVDEFVLMLEEEPDLSDPEYLEEQARGELEARGVPVTG